MRYSRKCACAKHEEISAAVSEKEKCSSLVSLDSKTVHKYMWEVLDISKKKKRSYICKACIEYAKTQDKVWLFISRNDKATCVMVPTRFGTVFCRFCYMQN